MKTYKAIGKKSFVQDKKKYTYLFFPLNVRYFQRYLSNIFIYLFQRTVFPECINLIYIEHFLTT